MKRGGEQGSPAADEHGAGRRRSGRGRPPKFGRPSQVIALTLPEDVLERLRGIHRDVGWAIVRLVESTSMDRTAAPSAPPAAAPLAELVHLPGKRALIVGQPQVFKGLRGIATIPLADGRAFLALDQGNGFADLELAILDVLEGSRAQTPRRGQLQEVRDIVRAWRRDPGLAFRAKSIIVVESVAQVERRPLGALQAVNGTKRGPRRRPG
jgi:hypothetical protein